MCRSLIVRLYLFPAVNNDFTNIDAFRPVLAHEKQWRAQSLTVGTLSGHLPRGFLAMTAPPPPPAGTTAPAGMMLVPATPAMGQQAPPLAYPAQHSQPAYPMQPQAAYPAPHLPSPGFAPGAAPAPPGPGQGFPMMGPAPMQMQDPRMNRVGASPFALPPAGAPPGTLPRRDLPQIFSLLEILTTWWINWDMHVEVCWMPVLHLVRKWLVCCTNQISAQVATLMPSLPRRLATCHSSRALPSDAPGAPRPARSKPPRWQVWQKPTWTLHWLGSVACNSMDLCCKICQSQTKLVSSQQDVLVNGGEVSWLACNACSPGFDWPTDRSIRRDEAIGEETAARLISESLRVALLNASFGFLYP